MSKGRMITVQSTQTYSFFLPNAARNDIYPGLSHAELAERITEELYDDNEPLFTADDIEVIDIEVGVGALEISDPDSDEEDDE